MVNSGLLLSWEPRTHGSQLESRLPREIVPSPSGQGALKGTKVLISPTVCTKASQFSSKIKKLCIFLETLDFQKETN